MAKLLPYKDDRYLWNYLPSIPGAIIFLVLFSLVTVVHSWRMLRHRVWFHMPLVLGCLGKSSLPPPSPETTDESLWGGGGKEEEKEKKRHGLTYHGKHTQSKQ